MRRRLAAAICLLTAATACVRDSPDPPGPTETPSGQVSVAYPQEPPGLNPYLVSTRTIATADLLRPVLPTLLSIRPDLSYAPGLAGVPKAADISKDGTRVTFRIDPDARWSDGVTITASDVIFTWRTIMDARWPIASRAGYDRIRDIESTSPRTFTIVFDRRYSFWRRLFSGGDFILPRHALEGKDFTKEMIDTLGVTAGPFKIDRWEKGLSISYVPDPGWWGRGARVARVTVLFVPSIDTAVRLFKAGRLDAVASTSQVNLRRRLSADGVTVSSRYGAAWWELVFSTQNRGISDVRFSSGIAALIDREGVAQALFKDEARVLNDPVPAGDMGKPFARHVIDLDKAGRSLSDAGWPNRSGGRGFSGRGDPVVCADGSNEIPALFERAAQTQADKIGLQLELRNSDAARVVTAWMPEAACDLFILERRGARPGSLIGDYHSRYRAPAGSNFSRIGDGDLDAILDGVDTGTSKHADAAARLAGLLPALPLMEVQMVIASKGFKGAAANASYDGPFWNMGSWARTG